MSEAQRSGAGPPVTSFGRNVHSVCDVHRLGMSATQKWAGRAKHAIHTHARCHVHRVGSVVVWPGRSARARGSAGSHLSCVHTMCCMVQRRHFAHVVPATSQSLHTITGRLHTPGACALAG